MTEEGFTERFNRLTADMSEMELANTLGVSVGGVRKLRSGETQSLKIASALRLCDRLGVSPWYLAFGQERAVNAPEGLRVVERGNSIQISLMPGTAVIAKEGGIEMLLKGTALALRRNAAGDPERIKAIDLLFGPLGREP